MTRGSDLAWEEGQFECAGFVRPDREQRRLGHKTSLIEVGSQGKCLLAHQVGTRRYWTSSDLWETPVLQLHGKEPGWLPLSKTLEGLGLGLSFPSFKQ